ncbi:putative Ribbon-helix-helix protein CopG domain-containing protein [Candidatus Magnetomoraceae bacterium gMMP-15]
MISRQTMTNIYFDSEIYQILDKRASETKRSISYLVNEVVKSYYLSNRLNKDIIKEARRQSILASQQYDDIWEKNIDINDWRI